MALIKLSLFFGDINILWTLPLLSYLRIKRSKDKAGADEILLLSPIKEIDLHDFTEAIPAFLTIIMMPFAYSISDGIVFGVISYIILKLFSGKRKEISLTTVILGLVFLLKFLI